MDARTRLICPAPRTQCECSPSVPSCKHATLDTPHLSCYNRTKVLVREVAWPIACCPPAARLWCAMPRCREPQFARPGPRPRPFFAKRTHFWRPATVLEPRIKGAMRLGMPPIAAQRVKCTTCSYPRFEQSLCRTLGPPAQNALYHVDLWRTPGAKDNVLLWHQSHRLGPFDGHGGIRCHAIA